MFLRQSTSQIIRFGPFLDSTDGVTAETGLTIAQADMQLSKDGAAYAQKNAAGNATHDTDGWYSTTLNTTDTVTVGELYMQVVVSGSIPVWVRYWVLEEVIYDDLYGASAAGYLQPTTAGRTVDITATGAAGIDWGNVENQATAVDLSGTDIQLVDTTTTNTDMRGTNSSLLAASAPTNFGDLAITVTTGQVTVGTNNDKTGYSVSGVITTLDGLNNFDAASDAVANVTLCATTTTNTDMRGTDSAATAAALATVDANVDAILVDTGTTLPAQITALNDITVSDILTTQMAEAYASDGVAPTLAQALFLIQQTIGDFSITGTTITTNQLDGSTTAATYTLDDDTNPTSRTRAT